MRNHLAGRLLLGLLAVAPILVVGFVVTIMLGVRSPTLHLGRIAIIAMLIGVVLYATAIAYFLYVVQTDETLDSSDKARWTFFLLMWFPFAAISFWYQFIWNERSLSR